MKVWPIDPLVPRNLRLEVPEKLMDSFSGARACAGDLCWVARLPNCGKSLRAQTTKREVKALRGRGNDLGYSNIVWDWEIRSQVLSHFAVIWMQLND